MRLLFLAAAAVAAWLVLRRRAREERRVLVGWQDGSEVELRGGTREQGPLLEIAESALR
jgi:hypothetical protein